MPGAVVAGALEDGNGLVIVAGIEDVVGCRVLEIDGDLEADEEDGVDEPVVGLCFEEQPLVIANPVTAAPPKTSAVSARNSRLVSCRLSFIVLARRFFSLRRDTVSSSICSVLHEKFCFHNLALRNESIVTLSSPSRNARMIEWGIIFYCRCQCKLSAVVICDQCHIQMN
jgi:hypothetical protein